MVRKVQSWTPDTHPGVTVVEEWDTDDANYRVVLSVSERAVDPQTGESVLVELPDPAAAVAAIRTGNDSKNVAYNAIIDAAPDEVRQQVVDEDGDPLWRDAGGDVWSEWSPGNLVNRQGVHATLSDGGFTPLMALKSKFVPEFRVLEEGETPPAGAVLVGDRFLFDMSLLPPSAKSVMSDAAVQALSVRNDLLDATLTT